MNFSTSNDNNNNETADDDAPNVEEENTTANFAPVVRSVSFSLYKNLDCPPFLVCTDIIVTFFFFLQIYLFLYICRYN